MALHGRFAFCRIAYPFGGRQLTRSANLAWPGAGFWGVPRRTLPYISRAGGVAGVGLCGSPTNPNIHHNPPPAPPPPPWLALSYTGRLVPLYTQEECDPGLYHFYDDPGPAFMEGNPASLLHAETSTR